VADSERSHRIYSDERTLAWSAEGCRTAGIGCLDCKQPLIESINAEQAAMRERAVQFEQDPDLVHSILLEGAEKARVVARETLDDVRAAIGISHK
jgi:tryptophanyl-tRNA synthetase